MLIYSKFISYNALSLLLLVYFVSIYIKKATSSTLFTHDYDNSFIRRAEEYILTSTITDGVKRSNVCGDGYRIEGALLRTYPYSESESYLPYENCIMTFQARPSSNQIRIHIVRLDLNDIHGGTDCLDSLRFYKSAYIKREDKLDTLECGKIAEAENFNIVSPTGIVTVHFSTDGGNVSGLGFKVILTSFRYPNKTHPCDRSDDEFLCTNGDCISSLLLCDGVAHCLDGSDEIPNRSCIGGLDDPINNLHIKANHRAMIAKHQHWRGILIIAFLLIIFIVFVIFMVYFICRRCVGSSIPVPTNTNNNRRRRRRNYRTIVHSPLNGTRNSTTTQVIAENEKNRKRLDDDYNLL